MIRIRVSVHYLALCALCVLLCLNPYAAAFLLAAAVHEAGHLLTAAFCGCERIHLSVLPFGCGLTLWPTSLRGRRLVIVAGCLFGAGLSLFAFFCAVPSVAAASLLLTLFNLLPLPPFDGYRLLQSLRWEKNSKPT